MTAAKIRKIPSRKTISVDRLPANMSKEIMELQDPAFITKNRRVKAVIVSIQDYRELSQFRKAVEKAENREIKALIDKRTPGYHPRKTKDWELVKMSASTFV